jgi:hypothetical protein
MKLFVFNKLLATDAGFRTCRFPALEGAVARGGAGKIGLDLLDSIW